MSCLMSIRAFGPLSHIYESFILHFSYHPVPHPYPNPPNLYVCMCAGTDNAAALAGCVLLVALCGDRTRLPVVR